MTTAVREEARAIVPKKQPYMFGSALRTYIWRDPPRCLPVWTVISRDNCSNRWDDEGDVQEYDLEAFLDHFGLQLYADRLSLSDIREMSPAALVQRRRELEKEFGKAASMVPKSTRNGGNETAEECI